MSKISKFKTIVRTFPCQPTTHWEMSGNVKNNVKNNVWKSRHMLLTLLVGHSYSALRYSKAALGIFISKAVKRFWLKILSFCLIFFYWLYFTGGSTQTSAVSGLVEHKSQPWQTQQSPIWKEMSSRWKWITQRSVTRKYQSVRSVLRFVFVWLLDGFFSLS